MKVKISKIKFLALKLYESDKTDEEIRKEDVSDLLLAEIEDKIYHKELLNISIIGEVTTGKSTLAIELMETVGDLINITPNMQNICGDQLEFLRTIKESKVKDTVIMIDEWNKLGESGYNATVEENLLTYYSEVQAQRYIHKISCSPSTIADKQSDLVLEVLSADKELKRTNFLLYYKVSKAGMEHMQLVGSGSLSVKRALSCRYYNNYRAKKFAKMDFIIKHGIKDVREIEQARMITKVYEDLERLTKVMPINKDIISNYLEKKRAEEREFLSILSSEDIIRKIMGLLNMKRTMFMVDTKIQKLLEKGELGQVKLNRDALKDLEEVHKLTLQNYYRLVNLGNEYSKI